MIPKTASLKPLDDQGVRKDRPSDEVKWSTLYNISVKKGRLVQRPALRVVNYAIPDATVNPSPTVAIGEQSARDEGLLTEIIRPNADGTHREWTSTDAADVYYTEIDEDPVDDTDYINTSTLNARASIEFGAVAGSYSQIWQVILYARFMNASLDADEVAKIEVYSKGDTLIDTVEIVSVGTPPGWINWAYGLGVHPDTSRPWTAATVGAFGIYFKYISNVAIQPQQYPPIADGTDAGWTKADLTQTNMYAEVDDNPEANDGATTRLIASSNGARVSFTCATNISTLFTTVNRAGLSVALEQLSQPVRYQLYFKSGTTYYNVGPPVWVGSGDGDYVYDTIWLDTNPITGVAYTNADFDGLEFGIQVLECPSGNTVSLTAINLYIDGTLAQSAEVRADQVFLKLDGMSATEPLYSHIQVTADSFLRGDAETGGDTVTDVRGAVTAPTTPGSHHMDVADFEGQLYFADGKDQLYRYPNGSNVFEYIGAGPYPTGKTIESFADRIVLGDILESGTRVRDQLRWCAYRDPTDWSSLSAGDLRLRQTPGAVVKVKNLLNFMIAYKEIGIYNCIHRADPNSPIYAAIQDPETGAVAMASVQAIGGPEAATHAFLGQDLNGYNVFKYNGDLAVPFGQPVADEIRSEHTPQQLRNAFGVTDPDGELYLLFICEGTQHFPEQCYVWSERLQIWLDKWHFPIPITSAGVWHISRNQATGSTHLIQPTIVLGTLTSHMYMLDPDKLSDHTKLGEDVAEEGAILQQFETGDLTFAELDRFVKTYETWLGFIEAGITQLTLSVSYDGGVTYKAAYDHHIGTIGGTQELRIDSRSVSLTSGRRVRFKIVNQELGQQLDLTDLGFEVAQGGKRP